MVILFPYTEDDVTISFLSIVRYALRYFNLVNIDAIEFWSKILSLLDQNPQWKPALLIVEICLCAPISNASLERLFSQMNLIKTTVRNRLKNISLNALLRIGESGINVEEFNKNHNYGVVKWWYEQKNRRMTQRKRKRYQSRKHSSKYAKRPLFDFPTISSSSDSSESESESDSE